MFDRREFLKSALAAGAGVCLGVVPVSAIVPVPKVPSLEYYSNHNHNSDNSPLTDYAYSEFVDGLIRAMSKSMSVPMDELRKGFTV